MEDRLYRSRSDRMITGVAGGIAERYDFDPSLVRIGWALLMLLTGGLFFLLYIVMAIVVPEEPLEYAAPTAPTGTETPMTAPTSTPDATGNEAGPSPTAAAAAGASTGWATTGAVQPGGPAPAPSAQPAMSARDARRAARRERRDNAPLIFGAILVIIGALAFAGQVFPGLDWDVIWPIGLIVVGGILIVAATQRRPSA